MGSMSAKVTKAFFESKGLHVKQAGDSGEVLIGGFAMENREGMMIIMHFDEDDGSAKVITQDLAKIPDNAVEKMYKVINDLNKRFRWIKFYIDDSDNTITAEDDAVIQLDSCGQEMLRCCIQLAKIADDAYPIIMKAIYS